MEISKYTLFINHKKGHYIYNSLSNSIIQVDSELFSKLHSYKDKIFSVQTLNETPDILDNLKKTFIVIDKHDDDLLLYKAIIWSRRKTEGVYNITIAPTMDCNFKCYYCFEEPQKEYLTEEISARISKFINNCSDLKQLNLTWFGGEPLLAFEQICQISRSIKLSDKQHSYIAIITNGYYLTENVVNNLEDLHINSIQVTVDGLFDKYDKIKFTRQDKHCFNKLIENIDYFAAKHKKISMTIRVNMTKKTMTDFKDVLDFFHNRYPNNPNITVHPAFLKNINNTTSESRACEFCSGNDKMKFAQTLFYQTKDKHVLYPDNNFNECAIRNHNSWAFGPDGSVYKCWENIGDVNNKIGFLDENGKIQITVPLRLAKYMYVADPLYDKHCTSCTYLPICFGMCPNERILSEEGDCAMENCAKRTKYLNKYISTLIDELY